MSKKNKNKNKGAKQFNGNKFNVDSGFVCGDDYSTLTPKTEAENAHFQLLSAKPRGGKKGSDIPFSVTFNIDKCTAHLNEIAKLVKVGQFEAVASSKNSKIIEVLTMLIKSPSRTDEMMEAATELVRICKTIYEYSDSDYRFIPDDVYDSVISCLLAAGITEPECYVPDDKKSGKVKVDSKWPLLQRNMNKAYAVHDSDEVPDGVKETTSVEGFLVNMFKAVGKDVKNDSIKLHLSHKVDGVSMSATVNQAGMLNSPQTRGNIGASILIKGLENLMVADNDIIMPANEFGVQYEVFITNEDKELVEEATGVRYANNRSAISGIIGQLCTAENDDLLNYISLYPIESDGLDMSYLERHEFIKQLGIMPKTPVKEVVIEGSMNTLVDEVREYVDAISAMRGSVGYAIDGVVVTVVDEQDTIGRSGKTNSYQIAVKFTPEVTEGIVERISVSAGRKGTRTVQVHLENPVVIDGVQYDHVPVLSADLYESMNLHKGARVSVTRVGDVIPSISVITQGTGEKLDLPTECTCGNPLSIRNKKLYCGSVDCYLNAVGRGVGFLETIGMQGYAESAVAQIIEASGGMYACPISAMIMCIGDNKVKFAKFNKELKEIIAETPDYKLLAAIGITGVGPEKAKYINRRYGGIYKLASMLLNEPKSVLADDKLSEDIKKSLVNLALDIYEVSKFTRIHTYDIEEAFLVVGHTGGKLSSEIVELCKSCNYEITDGGKFDILLTTDKDSASSKMIKAIKNDTPIYTWDEFKAKASDSVVEAYKPKANKDTRDVFGISMSRTLATG